MTNGFSRGIEEALETVRAKAIGDFDNELNEMEKRYSDLAKSNGYDTIVFQNDLRKLDRMYKFLMELEKGPDFPNDLEKKLKTLYNYISLLNHDRLSDTWETFFT